MKKFNTVEECFQELGLDFNNLPDVSSFPEEDRQYTLDNYVLTKVIKAHKGDWEPDFSNASEKKWFNWFWVNPDPANKTGFGFSHSDTSYDDTDTDVGARFLLPTKESAVHVRETFPQLYLNVHMVTVTNNQV
jgi:hypothetical protein